jgi:putative colanic acid biosynthesis acetyltransferase WcaF
MMLKGNRSLAGPSFTLGNRVRRQAWNAAYLLAFRFSPRPCHAWRAFLLRLFGATLGPGCHVYPSAAIWAPWNLELGAHVGVGDGVRLYSMDRIGIGDFATVSQGAFLCCGTHDYDSESFELLAKPIEIGAHAWICAEAFVHPGVSIPDGAVVGARAVAIHTLAVPWAVYAGNPCVQVGSRRTHE